MLELEEVREKLEVAAKKERQMQKNQEQANRFTILPEVFIFFI